MAGNPGDPGLWKTFTGAVKPETVGKELQKGDVLLHVGYTSMEPDIVKAARGAGAKVISIVAGTPSAPPEEYKLADLWLDPHWVLGDAELPIDGYDVRILPPSGTINIAMYWMITAEMVACGG